MTLHQRVVVAWGVFAFCTVLAIGSVIGGGLNAAGFVFFACMVAVSFGAAMEESERAARAKTVTFTCPDCGATSANPNDIRFRYCGRCHEFKTFP